MKDAGYANVDIDDDFFDERDSTGIMKANAMRFPDGMKPVVDRIHGLELKAGSYTGAGNDTCGSMSDIIAVDSSCETADMSRP